MKKSGILFLWMIEEDDRLFKVQMMSHESHLQVMLRSRTKSWEVPPELLHKNASQFDVAFPELQSPGHVSFYCQWCICDHWAISINDEQLPCFRLRNTGFDYETWFTWRGNCPYCWCINVTPQGSIPTSYFMVCTSQMASQSPVLTVPNLFLLEYFKIRFHKETDAKCNFVNAYMKTVVT